MKGMLIVWFLAFVGAGYGWIKNIINIVDALQAGTELTAVLVAQLVGVFVAPLGVILGYAL